MKPQTIYKHWKQYTQRITKEIKEEIKQFLESYDNAKTTHQDLLDTMKAVVGGQFNAVNAHIRKSVSSNK